MISRRTFLKAAGATAAGAAVLRLLGRTVFAPWETAFASGEVPQNDDKFVYAPYWGEDKIKTAVGGEILFFGDVHDMEDECFYYDPESGETRGVFSYLVKREKHPGLYACIGDYLQDSSDITQNADAYYKCTDRIRAWAGKEAPIISVMGNHEYKTASDGELNGGQVFEKIVGNNNYGLVVRGVDERDREKTLYYVAALGCAHTQEIDRAGARAGARNKYWVNPDAITLLDRTLAGIYGEENTENQGIPTFINAHIPIHYYTGERCAENNCELLRMLNKYPYAVYVWGHNHSEKDPSYGTVKLPGNTIVPNGSLADRNAAGEPAAQEIRFTYVACGAVRGNQISDHEEENSERALYVSAEGSRLRFEYCGRDGEPFDRTSYTDIREATHFEDFHTLGASSAAGLTVDLAEETDSDAVRRADFFLTRPIAGQTPGPAVSFSPRYTTGTEWLDREGKTVNGAFAFGEVYTARLTLSSNTARFELTGDDIFLFDESAKAIPSRYITRKTVTASEGRAIIDIEFRTTAVLAEEPLASSEEIHAGRRYVLASDQEQYLFTCSRLDCAAENGLLLTVPDADAFWTFVEMDGGYAMRSAGGKYLTAGMNGLNAVLVPVDLPEESAYAKWQLRDGALHIDMDGKDYILIYRNGSFVLASGAAGTVCRLYELS